MLTGDLLFKYKLRLSFPNKTIGDPSRYMVLLGILLGFGGYILHNISYISPNSACARGGSYLDIVIRSGRQDFWRL